MRDMDSPEVHSHPLYLNARQVFVESRLSLRSTDAGLLYSAVLTEAGAVLMCGYNDYGQLGGGDDELERLVPTAVAALAGEAAVEGGD